MVTNQVENFSTKDVLQGNIFVPLAEIDHIAYGSDCDSLATCSLMGGIPMRFGILSLYKLKIYRRESFLMGKHEHFT